MSEKDEAKEAADRAGGWETLARGLYDLYMTGDSQLLDAAFKREELNRLARAFNRRPGRARKHDLNWFFMVEDILVEAKDKNPKETEECIIGRAENLRRIYGDELGHTNSARDRANKRIRDELAVWRRELKHIRETYDPSANLALIANYEDHSGGNGEDDPRIYEVDE